MRDFTQQKNFLPEGDSRVNLKFPLIDGFCRCCDRSSEDLLVLPRNKQEVVCFSAFKAHAIGVSFGGVFEHIGQVLTSSHREVWRLIAKPGSVKGLPSFFNPQICEVAYVHEF